MIPRTFPSRGLLCLSRSSRLTKKTNDLFHGSLIGRTRSISLESLTTPFNRSELQAAASGNPNLDSEYYLVYIGILLESLTIGPLARRIATYRIGAFLLTACG